METYPALNFKGAPRHHYPIDPQLPNCIIVDLDGTLCMIHADTMHRHPYDWSKVEHDEVNEPVLQLIMAMAAQQVHLVFITGREEAARVGTENWLHKYQIPYSWLYMRKTGDRRSGPIVKQEIFDRHVRGNLNPIFCLDDEDRITDMWRGLGVCALQVGVDLTSHAYCKRPT